MRGKILCAGTHNKSSRKLLHERCRLEVHAGCRMADMTPRIRCSVGYRQRAKSLREFDGWTLFAAPRYF
jgi:hypothetical protein